MVRRNSILFVIAVLSFPLLSSAQIINEELFPALPFNKHNEKIVAGKDSLFFVVGSMISESNFFEDIFGVVVPYYFKKNGFQNDPIVSIPDTNHYYSRSFDGQQERIVTDFTVNDKNIPFVAWSKMKMYTQDYPPHLQYYPNCYTRVATEANGKIGPFIYFNNAINPSIAYKNDIDQLRIVYEEILPLDTLKKSEIDSTKFTFTNYRSIIFYDVPYTLSDRPITKLKLGEGFLPQVKIGFDNQVHVVWFGADSANATICHLKYRKALSLELFDSTITLVSFPLYPMGVAYASFNLPQIQWNVDSSGTLHIIWNTYKTLYALHYNSIQGVSIDSVNQDWIYSVQADFFQNDVQVLWKYDFGSQHANGLDFSSLSNRHLFSRVQQSGAGLVGNCTLLRDNNGGKYLLDFTNYPSLMQFYRKNFLSEKETTIFFSNKYYGIKSTFVDSKNNVWVLTQRDSTPVILNFNVSEIENRSFYFPLTIGDEWYYYFYPDVGQQFPETDIHKAIADTLMPNNKRYIKITAKFIPPQYYRKEGLKVFQYKTIDSTDHIRFDFSKNIGDTIGYDTTNNFSRIIIKNITVSDIFIPRSIVFSFEGFVSPDAQDYSTKVADSIGVIYKSSLAGSWQLFGAKINEKSYGIVLGVDNKTNTPPTEYSLSQNYPNPFNPTTTFNYQLPNTNLVSLKVYDVLGRELAVLVNELKNAGTYSVQWNAMQFASGVYFAKMSAGNFIAAKKILLTK